MVFTFFAISNAFEKSDSSVFNLLAINYYLIAHVPSPKIILEPLWLRKVKVSLNKNVPLYYQLENVLREKISSGSFQDGERMPTELELIEEYGVSRITVRQALKSLGG